MYVVAYIMYNLKNYEWGLITCIKNLDYIHILIVIVKQFVKTLMALTLIAWVLMPFFLV
jgi:hypothetical protein